MDLNVNRRVAENREARFIAGECVAVFRETVQYLSLVNNVTVNIRRPENREFILRSYNF